MLSQKSKSQGRNKNSNAIKLKSLINGINIQYIKQKLAIQTRKISNFKYIETQRYNPSNQQAIKKDNISKDTQKRHQLLLDSIPQDKSRMGSDAHIIALQNFNNKLKTLLKNKFEFFQTFQHQSRHQKERKTFQISDGSLELKEPQIKQHFIEGQSAYEHLKTTTSTASSPSIAKTTKEIRLTELYDQVHIKPKYLLNHRQFEKQLKITDFQIIQYLEQGQFGAVHLAKHISTNFLCALKKIPKHIFGGDSSYINQLARQIKIQSYLEHPNIVRLYSFFHDQSSIYLMMQYCSGGSLFSNLTKQNRMPQQKVKNYLKQICHALEFMHINDIIHRDIKPENILVHDDIVKICDFGWSINSPLLRSTSCGTPLYSSPEIILKKHYDSKIDVWNIGILTHQLLYGKVPFQMKSAEDLIKIVHEDISFSKYYPVSPSAKDFVLRCLKKNPKQRDSMTKLLDHQFLQQ